MQARTNCHGLMAPLFVPEPPNPRSLASCRHASSFFESVAPVERIAAQGWVGTFACAIVAATPSANAADKINLNMPRALQLEYEYEI
jgi:hypothetical protein